MNDEPKQRSHYVPAPGYFALNHACELIDKAFDRGYGIYLVGSALECKDYRDIDVRAILPDEEYDRLFKDQNEYRNPLWTLMCLSISTWLRESTGLPIDFQIQRQTEANKQHQGRRSSLGFVFDYPGERPTDIK